MKRRRLTKQKTNPQLNAAIMEALDNQLRDNDPPETRQTLERLKASGIAEPEVRRLIACVLAAEIADVMKTHTPFNLERFVSRLNNLPAMPWDDALYEEEP